MCDELEKLLPCPFCGSTKVGLAASQDMADGGYTEPREWSVLCDNCGASCSLHCESERDAKLSWNHRAGADAMSDDISEIVRQLRTGEAIDRTAIAATLERLSAGKEEAFQWADKFKARAEAAEARLHAMSDEIERLRADRDAALTDARLMRENWAEADEAIAMAANRLDIAVSGDADTQHCIEVALSYLRPAEG